MSDDERTADRRSLRDLARSLAQLLLFVTAVYMIGFINSSAVLGSVVSSVPTPVQLLDSAVSTLSPGYSRGAQLQVSLRLMQTAVLYFAVLVAVLRFMDTSPRFSARDDRPLFAVVLLSVLSVSVSAFLAVVSTLRIATEAAFVGALLSMGLAFLLSFLTPGLAIVSESRGTGQPGDGKRSQPARSPSAESGGDDGGEETQMAHALGWKHCTGDEQRAER